VRGGWIWMSLVVVVGLLAAAPSASAITKRALEVEVVTGPRDDVRCTIAADLHVPDGASRANPVPAIMGTNGFGGSKAEFDEMGPAFARRGYAFLSYSGLGFGGSTCKISLDDPDVDGKAGAQLLSFLAGTKPAKDGFRVDFVRRDGPGDPRVGMIGGSYGGQVQFAVAAQDGRMDAIVPQITWNDLSYSLTPNNTDLERGVTYRTPGVAKLDWPVLFFGVGVARGFENARQDPARLAPCPNFEDRVCRALVQAAGASYPDAETLDLLRGASVATYMERVRAPTLLVQGQTDNLFNLQEAVATYRALRAQGTPVKMLWRSAGHNGGSLGDAEFDQTDLEAAYESRMALEWLDFHLRGLGDRPVLDFSFFADFLPRPKDGDAAPAVGSVPAYPAARDERLFLSGAGALIADAGRVAAGRAPMAAVPAVAASGGGGFAPVPQGDGPGTSVAFQTAPLDRDVDVAGIPALDVRVDAPTFAGTQGADPAGRLVLVAKLVDVAPDGSETLPRDLVSAVRVADVTEPVRIELPGIVHRFAKGHRMRLVVATGSATYAGNRAGGPVTITTDPAAPGMLTVPRLGAPAGPAGSGPNGSTPFTPPPGAPAPQRAPDGPRPAPAAATLPTAAAARSCTSRRRFRIRLRRAPRGDRSTSAVVRVNGRRARVIRPARRGGRLRATVDLRGLPRGTFRVTVVQRTARGRRLESARTYRTCVPARR